MSIRARLTAAILVPSSLFSSYDAIAGPGSLPPPFSSKDLFPGYETRTGSGARSVAAADLDSDGDIDLIVANSGVSNISVLRNDGFGNFGSKVDFPTGAEPVFLVHVDVSGDGVPDVITANERADTVSVLLGLGNGAFAAPMHFAVGADPKWLAVGDVDGDALMDVVVANNGDHTVSVLRGTGGGALAPLAVIPTGEWPQSVALGDLDNDGLLDLAIASGFEGEILQNAGGGAFEPWVSLPDSLEFLACIRTADLDGDGITDLALTSRNKLHLVLSSNGGPGSGLVEYAVSWETLVELVDIDGDDDIDAVVADVDSGVWIMRNTGSGVLASPDAYGLCAGNTLPCVADVTGDGHVDVVDASPIAGSISVLRSKGPGEFESRIDLPGFGFFNGALRSAELADLNGDGWLDAVTASFRLRVSLNDGAGNLTTPIEYPLYSRKAAVGDVNGDLAPDIYCTSGDQTALLLNNGDGSFTAGAVFPGVDEACGVAIGDLNGDGLNDVVGLHTLQTIESWTMVRLNLGGGVFADPVVEYAGLSGLSFALADLDLDGTLDMAIGDAHGALVLVRAGLGDGSFGPITEYGGIPNPVSVRATDTNADGYPDLVVAAQTGARVYVMRNAGDGTFADPVSFVTGSAPRDAMCDDVSGDGIADLVVVNTNASSLSVLVGRGDGTFMPRVDFSAAESVVALALGDLDDDGDLDVVTTNALEGRCVSVFKNRRRVPGRPCPADVDGDAYVDATDFVVLASYFGSPVPPGTLGDLNGDGLVNTADFVILAADFGCGSE
jgi:hypothetical protein